MATTNLASKTLGTVLVQSGNGTPNHVASIGSYYTNVSTGTIYINNDGTSTGWDPLYQVCYAEVYIQENTTAISGTASAWATLTGLTWTVGSYNGPSVTTDGKITVTSGRNGRYAVIGSGSFTYLATQSSYDLGISINNGTPSAGAYTSGGLSAARLSSNVTPIYYFDLAVGDTVQLKVRPSANGNFQFTHGGIILYKVSD